MHHSRLAFLVALFVSGAQVTFAQLKIACIGDSITEGSGLGNPAVESYPPRLQRLLGTNYIVRNFGVGGRTLLKEGDFPYWREPVFKQSKDWDPDIVIIQLGTNDSKPQNWKFGTNFVSEYEEFITNYTGLKSAPWVVLCTPCPVYANGAYGITPSIVTTNIAPMVRDLANRMGLELVDLRTRLDGHKEWFPDTVHPNSKGMVVMSAIMYDALLGGRPSGSPPEITITHPSKTQVALTWPAAWGNLVPQYTLSLRTNTTWSVLELPTAYGDGELIHQTNSVGSSTRLYRLWQP